MIELLRAWIAATADAVRSCCVCIPCHVKLALSMTTVHDALVKSAARYPDHELLAVPGWLQERWSLAQPAWTYRESVNIVAALAERYRAAGYGPGHRIALLLENRPQHFFHWLALNAIGASAVPLNPDHQAAEADYILRHSGSALVIAAAPLLERIGALAQACRVAAIDADSVRLPSAVRPAPGAAEGEAREAALLYTSGTTGRPKGCLLSNGYFLGWGEWYAAQAGLISLRPGAERLLQPLPTFHVNAMGNSFMGMLFTGGTQIILDRFHPRSWWRDAAETGATCFHYLGVMPAMLLALPESPHDRGSPLRFGMGGGVHPQQHAAFEARFGMPLLEGWAMTETGAGGILCAAAEPRHPGTRCIGRPDRPGPPLEVRICREDGSECAPGAEGELLMRARGDDPRRRFFSGYLNDAEATDQAWAGGWLHTGDVVRQGADGSLHFVDRRKNIVRRSGENISAAEVETVLAAHPAVAQVAVVAALDPIRGEEVLAVVVPRPGHDAGPRLAAVLFEHCHERLAYYKAPGWIAFRESLPTTSTQKVRKGELAPLCAEPGAQRGCFDLRERKRRPSI
jgi:acyl-CoA synthetase (AMP-forming)/AMP-acid ligase II